jgi:hypothetical protein
MDTTVLGRGPRVRESGGLREAHVIELNLVKSVTRGFDRQGEVVVPDLGQERVRPGQLLAVVPHSAGTVPGRLDDIPRAVAPEIARFEHAESVGRQGDHEQGIHASFANGERLAVKALPRTRARSACRTTSPLRRARATGRSSLPPQPREMVRGGNGTGDARVPYAA